MNLILIGAQGSGKGTQAQRLSAFYRLKPCASGELLRDAMAKGTPNGLAAKPYYDDGKLVPDQYVVGMVLETIDHLDGARGILLDGFPRNHSQAMALDTGLAERHMAISAAVYLEVPREQLVERLSGRYICKAHGHVWNVKTNPPQTPGVCDLDGSELFQRNDDTGEAVRTRLDIFFGETIHLVDYYTAQDKFVRVDGSRGIDEVSQSIVDALHARGLPEPAPELKTSAGQ